MKEYEYIDTKKGNVIVLCRSKDDKGKDITLLKTLWRIIRLWKIVEEEELNDEIIILYKSSDYEMLLQYLLNILCGEIGMFEYECSKAKTMDLKKHEEIIVNKCLLRKSPKFT